MVLEKNRGRLPMTGELAVVVGAGRSGMAAALLLRKRGARVRLLEKNTLDGDKKARLVSAGVEFFTGPHEAAQFEFATVVIPSPAMPMHELNALLGDNHPRVISELELAWRCLDKEPVFAITGTSGKTTTASLAAAMLKAQGYSVFLGGNIGTPLSEYVLAGRRADVLVLECSSFQLQGCITFCPRVAALLNISPNHLDHHKSMAEYVEAKFRIFRCQDAGDLALFGPGLVPLAEKFNVAARKLEVNSAEDFPDRQLLGEHNALNAEFAWQGARFFGVSLANAQKAVASFAPLPHRLENLGEHGGITYVNDSKCTTVAALKVALEAFNRPVRLLCGGKFKGGDLGALAPLIREKVKQVALYGGSRNHFEEAWAGTVPMSWHETLREAVARLRGSAERGDVILLAPATSSFDQYKDYTERGEDFRRVVSELA